MILYIRGQFKFDFGQISRYMEKIGNVRKSTISSCHAIGKKIKVCMFRVKGKKLICAIKDVSKENLFSDSCI